jgi:hypothetical protein
MMVSHLANVIFETRRFDKLIEATKAIAKSNYSNLDRIILSELFYA